MRTIITVLGVLSIATVAMGLNLGDTMAYSENWNKLAVAWQTPAGMTAIQTDPTVPPGWGGVALKMANYNGSAVRGTYNDLTDGYYWTDPMEAGWVVEPKMGNPIKLSTGYRIFSDKACGAVNWEMMLSGPDHTVGIRAPGGGGDGTTLDYYEIKIDDDPWVDTDIKIIQGVVGQNWWDMPVLEIGHNYIAISITGEDGNGGQPHPNYPEGSAPVYDYIGLDSYLGWGFDTITISTDDGLTDRAGYFAQIDLMGGLITPEPMTLVLLGLGGLFLRRRR